MTLKQFKILLNKEEIGRYEKSLYVYYLREEPVGMSNDGIASLLKESKSNASNLYRYAKELVHANDIIFLLALDYIKNNASEIPPDMEVEKATRILQLKEAKKFVEQIKKSQNAKRR